MTEDTSTPHAPERATPRAQLAAIEEKWQARWAQARVHEPEVREGQPKFFVTYPYSYMNAFAHVGHAFTMMRSDLFARYRRMQGDNALYPFAFHVTGTPIVAAANRVRDGEVQQIKILRDQGIPESDIPLFADPVHWVRFFPKEWRQDVQRLGLGVDWRREFITTDLNPHYDAFIKWQFRKLLRQGRVAKGRHPIIWCPRDQAPVADHDRYSGEGETPQEWTVYKMRLHEAGDVAAGVPVYLLAATLRPDTLFGQTNAWVDPAHDYVVVRHENEAWVLNATSAKDLAHQFPALTAPVRMIAGRELVGRLVRAAGLGTDVPILPAAFIRHEKGTGIVTSVPSDSPQDLLSLKAVQDELIECSQPAREAARAITIIPVIRTARYGADSAQKAVEETGARDHRDADRIAAATEKAYQAGFYEGVMLDNAGEFSGMPVAEAKEGIKKWLAARSEAIVAHWPSGPVVCRCLTPSVVKVVSDQWFVRYGDDAWKAEARAALEKMQFYPPLVRRQFEYVVGWLRDWACTREHGLGTRLPGDERWLIESLSDSTIYMAYYTFAHLIERGTVTGASGERAGVDPADLSDAFFEYVMLGKGSPAEAARGTVTPELAAAARREFTYWYPLDFRNSGKDLVQNHLTFLVFNHTAVWEDARWWPRAIGVNGWVMVDGEKMSKSRGNFITLRQALDAYGASATRFALTFAGEGVDDANFDRDVAQQGGKRLRQWLDLARDPPPSRDGPTTSADRWFLATVDRLIAETRAHMEVTEFRTALKTGYYDLQREWAWYVRRCGERPHADVLERFLRVQNAILTPFAPHVAEEIHEARGWKGFAIDAPYPEPSGEVDATVQMEEDLVRGVLDDVRSILKVTKMTPRRIVLTTAPAWKRRMHALAVEMARRKELSIPALMKAGMADALVREKGSKDAPKLAQDLHKLLVNLGEAELTARGVELDEVRVLAEAAAFLATEFNAEVRVQSADDPAMDDPAGKARFAAPRKPAIYIEGDPPGA